MSSGPFWLLPSVVEAMHDEQIAEHGGAAGLRSPDLPASALAWPVHLQTCGQPDVFDLAAVYAYGIVKNHPFVDGNKRTGFLAAYEFLRGNGQRLAASQSDAVRTVSSLADGGVDEASFAEWLGANADADSGVQEI